MNAADTREWTYIDKTGWPDGPWHDEPDKIRWSDPSSGLACLIQRGPYGHLCGYVAVPKSNPWYGTRHHNADLNVHGSLTFSGPGEKDDSWWLGFDCGHAYDYLPGLPIPEVFTDIAKLFFTEADSYKDRHFVAEQCLLLASQL